MKEKNTPEIKISQEQYDALVIELVPAMVDFFKSENGARIFAEYQNRKRQGERECA